MLGQYKGDIEPFFRIKNEWCLKAMSELTQREFKVLMLIAMSVNGFDNSPLNKTHGEIGLILGIERTNISATIRKLIKKSWIKNSNKGLSLNSGILTRKKRIELDYFDKSILSSNGIDLIPSEKTILSSNGIDSIHCDDSGCKKGIDLSLNDKSILSSNGIDLIPSEKTILSSNGIDLIHCDDSGCKKGIDLIPMLSSSKRIKTCNKKEKNFNKKRKINFEKIGSKNRDWETAVLNKFDLIWWVWTDQAKGSISDCLYAFEDILSENVDDWKIIDKLEIALYVYIHRTTRQHYDLNLKNWFCEYENWFGSANNCESIPGMFWDALQTEKNKEVTE